MKITSCLLIASAIISTVVEAHPADDNDMSVVELDEVESADLDEIVETLHSRKKRALGLGLSLGATGLGLGATGLGLGKAVVLGKTLGLGLGLGLGATKVKKLGLGLGLKKLLPKKLKKFGGGFEKEKKPAVQELVHRKCDVIWEEKVTPLCKSVNNPYCHTEWRDECHKEYDTDCWNVQVEECTSKKICEWITEKLCKTEYSVTCDDDHHHRKKREVSLPDDVDDFEIERISDDDLSKPEIEMMITKPIDITGMSDDEITRSLMEQNEDESADEEIMDKKLVETEVLKETPHSREKRSLGLVLGLGATGAAATGAATTGLLGATAATGAAVTGLGLGAAGLGLGLGATGLGLGKAVVLGKAVGLGLGLGATKLLGVTKLKTIGGLKLKKSLFTIPKKLKKFVGGYKEEKEPVVKEHICHHHPNTQCWDEPREKCWNEPVCHEVPKQQCKQVPRDVCTKVDYEVCEDVWEEQCEYLKVKVAKKHCRDEHY